MSTVRTLFAISLLLAMISPTAFAQGLPPIEPGKTNTGSQTNTGQELPKNESGKTNIQRETNTGNEFKITDFKEQCLKDLSKEPVAAGDFGNVSFGPTVGVKALTYDLSSEKVSFNTGLGAGVSMRLYNDVKFYSKEGKETERYSITRIRKQCRGETFDGSWLQPDNQKIIPWISISPMVFASKTDREDEIAVQPALTVGFLGELINVGTGFNLSGPDKGHVFLLLTLGYGFKF